eukprot:3062598-Prymnesium_polylepis.2
MAEGDGPCIFKFATPWRLPPALPKPVMKQHRAPPPPPPRAHRAAPMIAGGVTLHDMLAARKPDIWVPRVPPPRPRTVWTEVRGATENIPQN